MKDPEAYRAKMRAAAERKRLTGGYSFDPTPGPYPGLGAIRYRRYETPEQRAFRRFPIDKHKPGG